MRRATLLWWAAAFVVSCLLNFILAAEAPRAWLSDAANYAAGSAAAAIWSLLVAGWVIRRRSRRAAVGGGFALAAAGGLLSGSVAAFAGGAAAAALRLPQVAVYQFGFDVEHYAALFAAWYFICLLLFSIEQTARIEEDLVRLRVLVLRAQDADLRERVRPEALSGSFARVRAALAQREAEVAEAVVLTLAEDLRRALSSQDQEGSLEDRCAITGAGLAQTAGRDPDAIGVGARFANDRLVDRVFWGCACAVMFVSISPVYLHSSPKAKSFAVLQLAAFGAAGYIASRGCRILWRVLDGEMKLAKKALVVMLIAIGAAVLSAWSPAMVTAGFQGRVAPDLQLILTPVAFYIPLFVVWHCVYLYAEAVGREVAQRTVLAQTAEAAAAARNSMLRYQVRPHFLFNALNALLALIADRRWTRATATTEALSAYIERSFAEDDRELVPVGEQVQVLQAYLSIEKIRFGARLRFHAAIPERLAWACAPSLILQPLIENAMKYAVASTGDPVDVEISADQIGDTLLLRVCDSGGDPEAPPAPGLGMGLRNVAARLAGHYGERGRLECKRLTPKGFVVEIRLPLEFACTTFAA